MSLPVKSQQDLYDLFISIWQEFDTVTSDFSEGSMPDIMGGVFSYAGMELQRTIQNDFNKCFFSLAFGPSVTGGPDDLQTLAVDHFGDNFARPQAVASQDTITFSRPNNSNGQIVIPAGTIVKTSPDSNGNQQSYSTNAQVVLTNSGAGTDTSVSVGITALVAGAAGNATAGAINQVSGLGDSTITCSNAGNSSGSDAMGDAAYLAYIYNLIASIPGAVQRAVEAAAETVAGVAYATAIETEQLVVPCSIATGSPVATPGASAFYLASAILYVCDSSGNFTTAMIQAVQAAILPIQAFGVNVQVYGASTVSLPWSITPTFIALGPNQLYENDSALVSWMQNYINTFPIGTGFSVTAANAALLAAWPNDISAVTTTAPGGAVSVTASQKLVAGAITVQQS